MARRIEIELTSARPDGSWTWRAAGARQPKGSLAASLVYPGARVGDVVRADAEFALEGISIVSLYPPQVIRPEPERVDLLGPSREGKDLTTTSLLSRSGRPAAEGDGRDRPAWSDRAPRRPAGARAGPRGDGGGPGGSSPAARGRPAGSPPGRRAGSRAQAGNAAETGEATDAGRRPAPLSPGQTAAAATRRGAPRLSPASTHRNAALASVAPEQRPIAEQVLRGGIPAVRQAIEAQNAQARAEGRPEVQPAPFLAMAEELLPRLKAAAWRDRAEAVVKAGDKVALHDLRSVVMGADAGARDPESRLMAAQLRESFEHRVCQVRERWVNEIGAGLDSDKLLRALRASARPPDPGARFPAELAVRLSQTAGAAMAPQTPPDRWAALLEAVAGSPVRRMVKPVGLPPEPGGALLEAARHEVGRVPGLAPLLGIDMPPPPGPPRPTRPAPSRSGSNAVSHRA